MVLLKFLVFALLIIIIPIASWYEKKKQINFLIKNTKLLGAENMLLNKISKQIIAKSEISNDLYEKFALKLDAIIRNIGVVWKYQNNYKIIFDRKCEFEVLLERRITTFLNRKKNKKIKVMQYRNQNLIIIRTFGEIEYCCFVIVTDRKKIDIWNDFFRR